MHFSSKAQHYARQLWIDSLKKLIKFFDANIDIAPFISAISKYQPQAFSRFSRAFFFIAPLYTNKYTKSILGLLKWVDSAEP